MTRRAVVVTLVVASILAVAGCATSAGNSPVGHSTPKVTASASPSPAFVPTAPAGTPLGAGERVWAAFSERSLSYDAWWAQLKPLLSDSAQAVYVYDDPKKIPVMKVTGKTRVAAKAPDQPRYTVEVLIPTSKGQFALDLERRTLTSNWLLYAIKFPPGVH